MCIQQSFGLGGELYSTQCREHKNNCSSGHFIFCFVVVVVLNFAGIVVVVVVVAAVVVAISFD